LICRCIFSTCQFNGLVRTRPKHYILILQLHLGINLIVLLIFVLVIHPLSSRATSVLFLPTTIAWDQDIKVFLLYNDPRELISPKDSGLYKLVLGFLNLQLQSEDWGCYYNTCDDLVLVTPNIGDSVITL
jgi:hypothetical protein